jgi:hypothetical protein
MYSKRQYFLELLQNQRFCISEDRHLGGESFLRLLDESCGFKLFGDVIWIKKVVYIESGLKTANWAQESRHNSAGIHSLLKDVGILEYWNDDILLTTHFSIIPSFQASKDASVHITGS